MAFIASTGARSLMASLGMLHGLLGYEVFTRSDEQMDILDSSFLLESTSHVPSKQGLFLKETDRKMGGTLFNTAALGGSFSFYRP